MLLRMGLFAPDWRKAKQSKAKGEVDEFFA